MLIGYYSDVKLGWESGRSQVKHHNIMQMRIGENVAVGERDGEMKDGETFGSSSQLTVVIFQFITSTTLKM